MATRGSNRRREPGKASNDKVILTLALTAIAATAIVWVALTVGSRVDGVNPDLPATRSR